MFSARIFSARAFPLRLRHQLSLNHFFTPPKSAEDVVVVHDCCGNGCRDCVLINHGAAECDDYFAKLEAQMSASAVSSHQKKAEETAP